jgi:hypothetical protein
MSIHTKNPNRPANDPDRLFAAYFKDQLPAEWPACPRPSAEMARPAATASGDPAARSRWALAASVAILIGGCWYLSGQVHDGKARPGFNPEGGGANVKLLKEMGKKNTEPKMP